MTATRPLATNAPSHWPELRIPAASLAPGALPEGALRLQAGAALAGLLRGAEDAPHLAGVRREVLLEGGVLDAPLIALDGAREVPVLVYERADEDAAAHFAGARAACAASGEPAPVYYAPAPLREGVPPRSPLRPFGPELFSPLDGAPPAGRYAAWWATDAEPAFGGSRVARALDHIVRGLDGALSYAVAPWAAGLGLVPDDATRVELQGDPLVVPVKGPGGVPLLFTASLERGLGWRVPVDSARVTYRDRLWSLTADWAKALGDKVRERGWAPDAPETRRALAWWASAQDRLAGRDVVGVSAVGEDADDA